MTYMLVCITLDPKPKTELYLPFIVEMRPFITCYNNPKQDILIQFDQNRSIVQVHRKKVF